MATGRLGHIIVAVRIMWWEGEASKYFVQSPLDRRNVSILTKTLTFSGNVVIIF